MLWYGLNIDSLYFEQMVSQIYPNKFQLYKAYISYLIHFARVSSNVNDFYNRNQFSTAKILKQAINIINLSKEMTFIIVYSLLSYHVTNDNVYIV